MKTFRQFRQDLSEAVNHRFLTIADCRKAYVDGVREGSIGLCPGCGSPNLNEREMPGDTRECVDCGKISKDWRIKEDEGGAPTNNVGSGNIAGAGIGPQGEPGVSPNYQRKRKQLKLMNGPAVDPRMFADKIYRRDPVSVKEGAYYSHFGFLKPHKGEEIGTDKESHHDLAQRMGYEDSDDALSHGHVRFYHAHKQQRSIVPHESYEKDAGFQFHANHKNAVKNTIAHIKANPHLSNITIDAEPKHFSVHASPRKAIQALNKLR